MCKKLYPFRGVIFSPNLSVSTVLLDTVRLIMEAKNDSDNFIIFIRYKSVAFVNTGGFSGLVLRRPVRVAALVASAFVFWDV